MGGKRWQTPEQLNFIRKHIPAYSEAAKGSRKQLIRFWPILEAAWWGEFPLKDELVKKGLLSASVLEKGFEFVEGSSEEALYQKELNKRKEQIKTLIRYEYHQASLKSGISDPSRVAISTAAKNFVKPTRRCFQPQEMYYHLYKDEVDALFEAERAGLDDTREADEGETDDEGVENCQGEGDDGKEGKKQRLGRGWNLRLRRQIFTREWEKVSPKRRAAVMEEIEKQKTQIAMESSLEETGKGLARDADSRLGSLQRVNAFWASNAKLCWDNAAMIISYGLDSNGKVFQDAFPNFHEVIVKPIITWAKANVFTQTNWEKAKAERVASRQASQDDQAQGGEGSAGLAPLGEESEEKGGLTAKEAMPKESSAKGSCEEWGNDNDKEGEVDDNGLSLSDSFDAVHQLQPASSTDASSPVSGAQAELPSSTTIGSGPPPASTTTVPFPGTTGDKQHLPANTIQSPPSNSTQPLSTNPASREVQAPPPVRPNLLPSGKPSFTTSPQAHALNGMFGTMPDLFGKIVGSVPLQQHQGANQPVAPTAQENPTFLPETQSPQYLTTPGAMNQHHSFRMDPMNNASIGQSRYLGNSSQDSFSSGAGAFPFADVGSEGQGMGGGSVFPFDNSTTSVPPQMSLSAYLLDDNLIDPPPGFDTSYLNHPSPLPPFFPDTSFAHPPSYGSSGSTLFNASYSDQLSGAPLLQVPGSTDSGHSPLMMDASPAFCGQSTGGPVPAHQGLAPSQVVALTLPVETWPHVPFDTPPPPSSQPSRTPGTPAVRAVTTPPIQAPLQAISSTPLTGVPQTLSTPTAPTAPPQPAVPAVPTPPPGPPTGVLAITTNAPAKPSAAQGKTKTSKKATTTKPTKHANGPLAPTDEVSKVVEGEPPVMPKPKPKPTRKRKSDAVEVPTPDSVVEGRGKRTKTPAKRFDGEGYVTVGPVNPGPRAAKVKGDSSGVTK